MTESTVPEAPEDRGVSIYIAAHNAADARAIFEKAMELNLSGEHYDGKLVRADDDGGVAQLYTHVRRRHRA